MMILVIIMRKRCSIQQGENDNCWSEQSLKKSTVPFSWGPRGILFYKLSFWCLLWKLWSLKLSAKYFGTPVYTPILLIILCISRSCKRVIWIISRLHLCDVSALFQMSEITNIIFVFHEERIWRKKKEPSSRIFWQYLYASRNVFLIYEGGLKSSHAEYDAMVEFD